MIRRSFLTLFAGAACAAGETVDHAVADPEVRDGSLVWFQLTETMDEVARKLGSPRSAADFGRDRKSWLYYLNPGDSHDPSHYLVFRLTDRRLISVTRSYEPPRPVDEFFPAAETTTHLLPSDSSFGFRVRKLSGGRLLLASGCRKPGDATSQLMLMKDTELAALYPWIARKLGLEAPPSDSRR